MKNKPKLFILVGLSGSGKSTFAQKLAEKEDAIIVSSDAIREEIFHDYEDQKHNAEVFNIFHEKIRKALENKYNVIADATNITMKSRRNILNNVKDLDITKICYILSKPFEQCEIDNKKRIHPVSDNVLEKQIRKFQIPFFKEGFDSIMQVRSPEWYKYKKDLLVIMREMDGFDQKNPYHALTLDQHCIAVSELFRRKRCSGSYPSNIDEYLVAARLHDIGKLYCQTFDKNGVAHYYGHESYGSYYMLTQIKKPDVYTDRMLYNICFLINYHMLPFAWENDKTGRRWKERFGEYKYQMLLDFHECDIAR